LNIIAFITFTTKGGKDLKTYKEDLLELIGFKDKKPRELLEYSKVA